jgi:hypothetical protein
MKSIKTEVIVKENQEELSLECIAESHLYMKGTISNLWHHLILEDHVQMVREKELVFVTV